MNKTERGVMPEKRVLAKAVAVLCACGSAGIVLPAMAATTVTQYTYDAGDHVTTVTDPRGLITAYNVDGLGQLWGVSSPDTGTATYSYDAYGRRSSLSRANGITTTYGYDALNRPTTVSAGGQTQTFAYDSCTNGVGRLCTASDTTGSTAYSYTPEGWIAGRGFSITGTTYSLGYGYDAMGHLAAVTYPDGDQAVYSYSDGVVSGITYTMGGTQLTAASGVTWQPMNTALAGWTSSNGLANTLSYDADGRLTAITTPGVESLSFSYDTANRIAGIDNGINGALSQDFDYDDQSRLVSMYSATLAASYSYDTNGNRIASVQGGANDNTGYSATSNRLVSTTGTNPQAYGYDALGNLTTLNGSAAYQYDAFNRMSAAGGMSYYVNPEGQRLRKAGSLGTTYFAPDQSGTLLAENDSGAWIDYLWLGGRLIGREVNGQLEAIGDDQVGRPQVVTNAAQTVVWSAQNWPFTQSVTVSNSAPLNLGFPGQYYDAETGLWNNGFRDYDSTLGRYVESDPLGLAGGQWSTYAYVGGNPVSQIDPIGLESPTVEPSAQEMSEMGKADAANLRLPDYATFQLDAYVFSISATYTVYGDIFLGPGTSRQYKNPLSRGVSISAGWLLTSCPGKTPSRSQLNNYLEGYSASTGGYLGFGGTYSVNSFGQAINLGVGAGAATFGVTPMSYNIYQGNIFMDPRP